MGSAVFGGGYNGAVNPNVGSAVFVMDPLSYDSKMKEDSSWLKAIDIGDTSAQMI